jgi:hypothetical protein
VKRLLSTILLAVIVSAILTGCGGPASPEVVLASASEKFDAQSSASVRMTMNGTIAGREFTALGIGKMDLKRDRVSMTVAIRSAGRGMQIDEIVVGKTVYVRLPAMNDLSWMSMDAATAFGADPSKGVADPISSVDATAAIRAIQVMGTSKLGGVPVTRYRGTVDMAQALGGTANGGSGAAQLFEAQVPFDLWIDEEGLPRKLSNTVQYTAAQGGGSYTATIEFSDFGGAVSILEPDPRTVTPITEQPEAGGAPAT